MLSSLILGEILIDEEGNKLETPIPDKIEYYEEVENVKPDKESNKTIA